MSFKKYACIHAVTCTMSFYQVFLNSWNRKRITIDGKSMLKLTKQWSLKDLKIQNSRDMNFWKVWICKKTFAGRHLLPTSECFHTKFRFLKIHIFVSLKVTSSKLQSFTNFNVLFPVMVIIFLSCDFWNYVIKAH